MGPHRVLRETVHPTQDIRVFFFPLLKPPALSAGPGVPQGQPHSLHCSLQVHILNFSFQTPSFQQVEAKPGSNVGCRFGAAPLQFCLACSKAEATTTTAESPSLELLPHTLSADGPRYFL